MGDRDHATSRRLAERLLASGLIEPEAVGGDPTWQIGRYEVLHDLGRGAQGEVFRARDPLIGRDVAIKLLAPGVDPERFRREAEAVAALRHPHVVQVHDAGVHDGRPYLVLEHVGGGTLEGAELGLRRRVELLAQVADACDAAHERGVVHRDLKPANVLLAEDGRAVVADFGVAKLLDAAGITAPRAIVGTPAAMAPEQLRGGAGDVGPWTDVHALGVMLYEALTGRLPYAADSVAELAARLLEGDPWRPRELVPDAPEPLERLALRALASDPRERPGSARAFAEELRAWLDGAGGPRRRRRPARVAAAAAAGAGILLALALALALRSTGPGPTAGGSEAAGPAAGGPAPPERSPTAGATAGPRPAASPTPAEPPEVRAPGADPAILALEAIRRVPPGEPVARYVTAWSEALGHAASAVAADPADPSAARVFSLACRLLAHLVFAGEIDVARSAELSALAREATADLAGARRRGADGEPLLTANADARLLQAALEEGELADAEALLREAIERAPRAVEPWLSLNVLQHLALRRGLPGWDEERWLAAEEARRRALELGGAEAADFDLVTHRTGILAGARRRLGDGAR